jgi:hypothetical protein
MLAYLISREENNSESSHNTVSVDSSDISIELLPARAGRKSLFFYNYSNKIAFVSANSLPATTNLAANENYKYLLPPNQAIGFDRGISPNSLQVIFEAGATGFLTCVEGW